LFVQALVLSARGLLTSVWWYVQFWPRSARTAPNQAGGPKPGHILLPGYIPAILLPHVGHAKLR
jgi:hypothetical protein